MPIVSVHFGIARCQHDIQPFLGDHSRDGHPGFHDGFSLSPARHCSENRHGWVDLSWPPAHLRGASLPAVYFAHPSWIRTGHLTGTVHADGTPRVIEISLVYCEDS